MLIVEQKVREVLSISDYVFALRMGEIAFSGLPSALGSDELKKIFLL
jgi:ABC-type branched-subunit amino acid transport system ATPase component